MMDRIEAYWKRFLKDTGAKGDLRYEEAYHFGLTPEAADKLLSLELAGPKRATCSSAACFAAEGLRPPQAGDLCILTDGSGTPRCVVRTTAVAHLPFEQVDYWPELCEIMEWSKTHVHSTLHICWGAQAGLYYHYGIPKRQLPHKLFGVFEHTVEDPNFILFRGFDDRFWVPHSRNTTVDRADIEAVPGLKVLAASPEAGVYAVKTEGGRQVYLMGHAEYDRDTLKKEYLRDVAAGVDIQLPQHYFPDDDPEKEPVVRWRSCANLLYSNWLDYFVYQTTPYDLSASFPDGHSAEE